MAEISQLKLPNNSTYNLRDDISTWGGRNLFLGTSWNDTFTGNVNVTGWNGLNSGVDTLDTSIKHENKNSVHRYRTGTTATTWSEFKYYCRDGVTLIPGEQYTTSVWIYCDSIDWVNTSTNTYSCSIRFYDPAQSTTWISTPSILPQANMKPNAAKTWERKVYTWTVPETAAGHTWWYMYMTIPRDIDMHMCQFKLEHGTKATDWCPAIEDLAYVNGTQLVLYS